MVPGDRIKVILQIQGQSDAPPKYNGPIDCLKKVYAEQGVRGLYKGTALTFLRDGPGSVAYYGFYEVFKNLLTKEGESASVGVILFVGGMSGIMNWLVAVPPDTLKSRFQTAPEGTYPGGIRQVASDLIAKEGIASLYKGITPAMARAFPANAAVSNLPLKLHTTLYLTLVILASASSGWKRLESSWICTCKGAGDLCANIYLPNCNVSKALISKPYATLYRQVS